MPVPGLPLPSPVAVGYQPHEDLHTDANDALNYLGSDSQSANLFLASPSGSSGAADFRAITAADIAAALAGGSGAIVLNEQAAPATPTNAIALFSDTNNRLAWKHENGFVVALGTQGVSADSVFSFPGNGGTVVTQTATQTLSAKSFSSPVMFNSTETAFGSGAIASVYGVASTIGQAGDLVLQSRATAARAVHIVTGITPAIRLTVGGTGVVDVVSGVLNLNQAPVAGAVVPTHTFTVTLQGVTYRVPCLV